MKKFKTDFQGLLPIYLDDIRFVNDGLQEQIEAIIKSLTNDAPDGSFIITGCELSGTTGNGNLSSGYVVLDGKIYRVPSQVLSDYNPGQSGQYEWKIQTQIVSGGTKQPKRTTDTVETWTEEIARLQPADDGILYDNCPKLIGNQLDYPWKTIALSGNFSHVDGSALQYKRCGNVVEIRGAVENNSPYGNLIATLPQNIRPKRELMVPCMYYYGPYNYTQLTLSENGELVYGADSHNVAIIHFNYFLT
jgi:hypothetical protein